MNPGVDPVQVWAKEKAHIFKSWLFMYATISPLQSKYPDGDRHLVDDSDVLKVCVHFFKWGKKTRSCVTELDITPPPPPPPVSLSLSLSLSLSHTHTHTHTHSLSLSLSPSLFLSPTSILLQSMVPLEEKCGITFRHISLLGRAFTHSSRQDTKLTM